MDSTVPVSVIVPFSGGSAQALRCLEGLALQEDGPAHEVIVVDDASVGLEDLLARLAGDVEVIRSETRVGLAGALALGAARARGETLVLLRDAAAPVHGWLAALVAALADPGVGLTASITASEPEAPAVGAFAVAVRAADLRAVGGVPPAPDGLVTAALAVSLAERAQRVVRVPSSVVVAPGARTGGARRTPGETPELTIVIPTLDAASERVRRCVAALQAATDAPHELVIVDNGAPPQGFAEPVNAGLRAARTPYVVVCNDDVEPLPGWWQPLRAALDAGAAVTFPLTVDGAMRRDFAAWCFAMTAETVEGFSHAPGVFFDPSLRVWYQDTDLLVRLRAAGRPPVLVESSRIRHGLSETVRSEDEELSAWIRAQVERDRETFRCKHPDVVLDGHAARA